MECQTQTFILRKHFFFIIVWIVVFILFRYAQSTLPYQLQGAASVQFGNTLLLVAGNGNGTLTDTVLEFDLDTETFIARTERLNYSRAFAGAVLVDQNLINCD